MLIDIPRMTSKFGPDDSQSGPAAEQKTASWVDWMSDWLQPKMAISLPQLLPQGSRRKPEAYYFFYFQEHQRIAISDLI
jgi:hypothetical protein